MRPEEALTPQNPILAEVLRRVELDPYPTARELLDAFTPKDDHERAWRDYILGVAAFAEKNFDEGMKYFSPLYQNLKGDPSLFDGDYRRITAKALKKIGWNYRRQKELEKAYTYHSAAYELYRNYGAAVELHDAAISLDVDAYLLGDMELDEYWLNQNLDAAHQISNPSKKAECLGMSYNNLAGTLYGMKRFAEAEKSILESMLHWREYEHHSGPAENKVVWAHFGTGDVYQMWAQHLSTSGNSESFISKKELAIQAFQVALALAEARDVKEEGRKLIEDRLRQLQDLVCASV